MESSVPFERGQTFYNGGTIDSNNLGGLQYEGIERWFQDLDYSATVHAPRTSRTVRCRCVRNVAAAALLPKRLGRFQASGTYYGSRVDGYATTSYERGYPIDEWLPTAGVPVNDLFWIVIEGPATVLTPLVNTDFNGDISVGNILVALTAATSGATTAGRVAMQNITASTQTADYSQILLQAENYVGRALSACTTGGTGRDLLVEVGHW